MSKPKKIALVDEEEAYSKKTLPEKHPMRGKWNMVPTAEKLPSERKGYNV